MTEPRRVALRVVVAALLPGAIALAGVHCLSRRSRARVDAETKTRASAVEAGPRVATVRVRPSASVRVVSVIAEARPYATVTLFAKISGYVREIPVDKGDAVKRGALLAILESPETDQQYEAARETAIDRRIEAKRAQRLWSQGVMSEQDRLTAQTNAEVAEAALAQLAAQKSYEVMKAPFTGTVTARFVDPGALVQSATGAETGAMPVVTVSTLDRLRVQAWVDQGEAAYVKVGDPVTLTMDERPGVALEAKVSRVAGELAPRTRTMLVEAEYDDARHDIVPGGFVHVGLRIAVPSLPEVPTDALVYSAERISIAIVGPDDRVHFRQAHVADTDGRWARLSEGAKVGDVVALNLGETVPDGTHVRPVAAPAPSASASASVSTSASAFGGGPDGASASNHAR